MSQAAAQQPSRKKTVISLLVLLALTCIIVFTFKDHWAEITAALAQLSVWQVLAVLAVGISYPLLEGCVAWVIVRSRLPQFTLRQGLDVGWCGTFGNVVTLGAGAVPVQLYYLHRAGLPLGPGAGLMTLEYVFHKSTVLLYATVMLLLQRRWLAANTTGVMRYLPMAYAVVAVIIVALVLLCVSPLVQNLARWLLGFLPKTEKWQQRRADWLEQLEVLSTESRRLLADKPRCLKIFALQALKLFGLFCLPYLCIRFMGLSPLDFWQVQLLTSLMLFVSNALPNVAGMGSIETAFLLVFGSFLEQGEVMSVLMLPPAPWAFSSPSGILSKWSRQRRGEQMKSFHIPRTALFFILFALAAFAVLYHPIDLKALVRASSQGTLRTEEVAHFGSTNDMDYHLLSMDSEEFQQTAELLSTVSCCKKLNQNYSAYTHDTFPVQSVTVSFYDDAENQKFLLTVYSDGVCILNSAYVSVKYPGGGAAQLYEQLAGLGQ